jgi:hypothetical protein
MDGEVIGAEDSKLHKWRREVSLPSMHVYQNQQVPTPFARLASGSKGRQHLHMRRSVCAELQFDRRVAMESWGGSGADEQAAGGQDDVTVQGFVTWKRPSSVGEVVGATTRCLGMAASSPCRQGIKTTP